MTTETPGNSPGEPPRGSPGLVSRFLAALAGRGKNAPPGGVKPPLGAPGNKVGERGGHRGMAFGRVGGGKEDVSPENRARWEKLRDTEAGNFVYNGAILYVHSSNVQAAQYEIETRRLIVSFLPKGKSPGGVYQYRDVTEDEAIGFANAHSKGSWVWDNLRVRGSKVDSKKDYNKIG